ncbi:hypothetical protein NQ315_012970 [Exocentrus adspersus]|uniref:Uncharacterized protein n=1 Tax=Exocentrus adspersus TaxID=1586481 RepID=A0AAV8VTK5_9CUCU|nr:hypothetical protein NQ315_012970 [Exocentrus adspersus]
MHIGAGTSGNSRFKKKQPEKMPSSTEWLSEHEKHKNESSFDDSPPKKSTSALPSSTEKSVSVRRAMAMKEPPKKPESPKKSKTLVPAPLPNKIPQGQVVLDKFGNFRLMSPPELKKGSDVPPLPPVFSLVNKVADHLSLLEDPDRTVDRLRDIADLVQNIVDLDHPAFQDQDLVVIAVDPDRIIVVPDLDLGVTTPEVGHDQEVIQAIVGDIAEVVSEEDTTIEVHTINLVSKTQDTIREVEVDIMREILDTMIGIIVAVEDLILIIIEEIEDQEEDINVVVIGIIGIGDTIEAVQEIEAGLTVEAGIRVSLEADKINKYNDGESESIRHEGPLSEGEDRDDYANDKLINRDEFAGKWAEKGEHSEKVKEASGEANMDEADKNSKFKKERRDGSVERSKDFLKK